MANRPTFKSIDMTKAMAAAEKGKYTVYDTYRFSKGISESYRDRIGGYKPIFSGRN